MEEYTHYGKQADVFKHLVLCELLKNEMPIVYIDTNSASAVYQLEHTPEQDYGIYHFLQNSSLNDKLKDSLYYKLESGAVQKGCYYGSPALAMKVLRANADTYHFFDLESKSLENVKAFAEVEHLGNRVIIRNCDSTKGGMDLLSTLSKATFLHIDPYEINVKGIGGHTYFDIFVQATQLGMKCLLWYGFMTLDDMLRLDKYIASCLQEANIQNHVIGAKLIMNNIEKNAISYNPGVLGSGLLASNLSDGSNHQLLDFTRLLVEVYKNSHYKGMDGSLFV
jgi:23S rRNA (adenine2030-N6)-methyltransferase